MAEPGPAPKRAKTQTSSNTDGTHQPIGPNNNPHKHKSDTPLADPIDEPLLRKMDAFLKQLMKRNQAVHFAQPVDWKKMGLLEYPKLIKQPMDLGTIQDKLARSQYTRLEEWATDCRLVWKNAFIFNAPDSIYFKAAKTLSDVFEKKMEELERDSEQAHPVAIDTMERCALLLGDMLDNPMAEWFLEPVDAEALGLLDYNTIITQPMDLGTVSKKLERTQYMAPDDFAHDVRLVWQNAIAYNSASSMFGVVASILATVFDRRFTLITRSASVDGPGRPIPDRAGWPTFVEKKKFYDLCTKLTLAELNHMVTLVQKGCAGAVNAQGQKEVEVDVDELDMSTFNQVMQWVSSTSKAAAAARAPGAQQA